MLPVLVAWAVLQSTDVAAEGKAWQVAAHVQGEVVQAQPSTLVVELTAREGYKVNAEYPLNFKPQAAPGVSMKARYGKEDGLVMRPCADRKGEACAATLPISFTATTATTKVAGTLAFSVCSADVCLIEKVPLSLEVTARSPQKK